MNDEIVSSDVVSFENIASEAVVPSESLVSDSEAQSVLEEKIEGSEAQSVTVEKIEGTESIPIGYSVVVDDRPFMTTPVDDFTVTEGLLLGILLVLLGGLIFGVFRRGRK